MTDKSILYWSLLSEGPWEFYMAATSNGLCYVGSNHMPIDELKLWASKKLPTYELIESKEQVAIYQLQFLEYLQGKRKTFDLPIDDRGTDFQRAVWAALREIPYGITETYSHIAERINQPKAVRAVGTAIGANPVLITTPCHRVIGKNGTLTGFRGGLEMKKRLLELENEQN